MADIKHLIPYSDQIVIILRIKAGISTAITVALTARSIFNAGGYQFLYFGFEMQPGDSALQWAKTMIDRHPGLPTIMSTHDYLNKNSERVSSIKLAASDSDWHNSAEHVWKEFIRSNRQIFMVLDGHVPGQATRVDKNDAGYHVNQLLADY